MRGKEIMTKLYLNRYIRSFLICNYDKTYKHHYHSDSNNQNNNPDKYC